MPQETMRKNLDDIMRKIERPFVSEADFKFYLAWALKEKFPESCEIRLEYPIPKLFLFGETLKKLKGEKKGKIEKLNTGDKKLCRDTKSSEADVIAGFNTIIELYEETFLLDNEKWEWNEGFINEYQQIFDTNKEKLQELLRNPKAKDFFEKNLPLSRIDMCIKNGNDVFFIELKYQTKFTTIYIDGQNIDLKEQGSTGRYGFIEDVCRMERIRDIKDNEKSYNFCILLTNDKLYWENDNKDKSEKDIGTMEVMFSLKDKIEKGVKFWNTAVKTRPLLKSRVPKKIVPLQNDKHNPIYIENTYTIKWQDCEEMKGVDAKNSNSKFRYLLLQIPSKKQ